MTAFGLSLSLPTARVLSSGAATPWLPTNDAAVINWWRKGEGIVDSGGGTATSWTDVIGSVAITQGTISEQPTITADGLDADSNNDLMKGNHSPPSSGNWLIAVVVNIDIPSYSSGAAAILTYGGVNNRFSLRAGAAGQFRFRVQSTGIGDSFNFAPLADQSGQKKIFIAAFDSDNSLIRLFIDGTESSDAGAYTANYDLGGEVILNSNDNEIHEPGGLYSHMLFADISVGSVAGTQLRQQLEGYFAHSEGIAGSLPSDHPYKSAAPTL